jgi:hypothetical protein
MSNFMKIRPVETEFFHEDSSTDVRKTTDDWRNFAKAPKKGVERMFMCVGNFTSQILQSKRFAKTNQDF